MAQRSTSCAAQPRPRHHVAFIRHAYRRCSYRPVRGLVRCLVSSPRYTLVLPTSAKKSSVKEARASLLKAITDVKGRGKSGMNSEQTQDLEAAVACLEADRGVKDPTDSPLLEGRWRLLFTTRPGSASPIQKTFVGVESFTVYQEVLLTASEGARVNNIVDFGAKIGTLKVEAEASTNSNARPGFVPRQKPGLAIFGKSSNTPPAHPNMRVDFQFDKAAFAFNALPFKIPYPVPFKLLGDETKGWIDVTYLSQDGKLRLTRGNKGTLFVLMKDPSPKQQLLEALASQGNSNEEVQQLVLQLERQSPERSPAKSVKSQGKWRLLWSMQASEANYLQKALSNRASNFQIIEEEDGEARVENVVQLGPLLAIKAGGSCAAEGPTRTVVSLNDIRAEIGPLRIPLPRGNRSTDQKPAYVDWLYLDDDLRITRGSKGSLFIHTKD
ncbi:hypothetical protein ABBQ32_009130 [Trebouxia sp. C0010 RCD-2024]